MRVEQMLTDALREEAESRDVDVTGLWARTREHLDRKPARRGRRLPVLAAAAASLVVVAGVVGLAQIDGPGDAGPAGQVTSDRDVVDDEFTCPEQITHDWTRPESVTDPYFVASLRGGPVHQASTHRAALYEYEEKGNRAFLRFGNADGTLALVSEFHRKGGDWVRFRSDVCTGENGSVAVPTDGELDLGVHEDEPHPVENMIYREKRRSTARLIDDRRYYDNVGLIRHRSMYAMACGRSICLSTGDDTGSSGTSVPAGVVPHDVSELFFPGADSANRTNPYGFWLLYDVEDAVENVSLDLKDGTIIWATQFEADGWPGTLYALVAPFDEVGALTVHHATGSGPGAGEGRNFLPEELPGYQADLHR